jgi:SAM-dependent methyltransferase
MREAFESDAVQEHTRIWLTERYCGGDAGRLAGWLAGGRKLILDAGCGAGLSAIAFLADHLLEHDYLGVDISDEAIETARDRFRERGYEADFLEASVSDVQLPDGSIDIIFSDGVLHHTDNTEASFLHLAKKLKTGGRFLAYVYRKKAVLREFADDHVRDALKGLSDGEAWEALKPLTKLGDALGRLGVTIDVPEDIPYLGIQKGTFDIQRFFYWNVCKLFHRPDFTIDEMNHINFDWYRPMNCHRHSPEEVVSWCAEAGLEIEHMDIQEAGISVVAKRGAA